MPVATIPLIKGTQKGKTGLATDYRDRLLVNMIAIPADDIEDRYYLRSHPGLVEFGQGISYDRGGRWNDRFATHYRVSGGYLVEVSADGTVTPLGPVSGATQTSHTYSFNNHGVVAGGRFYLHNQIDGFRVFDDPDLGKPIDVCWIDGYFFFTDGESIYHTDITDETKIDPLQFAGAEFMPDSILGVMKDVDNQVIVFGRYTTEYFINRATDNFAFQRITQKGQKIGIVGTHAKCEMGAEIVILGSREREANAVYIIGLGNSTRISSREIDRVIQQYTDDELTNVILEPRSERGIQLLLIHLPEETLLFNASLAKAHGPLNAWSVLETGSLPWQAVNGVYDPRLSKYVYGDKRKALLGTLTDERSSVYGEHNESVFYSPLVAIEGASIDRIELDIAPGFTGGRTSVAVSTTENGITFSRETFSLYGDQHNYSRRFIARALGYIRQDIGFKFRLVTDDVLVFSTLSLNYG